MERLSDFLTRAMQQRQHASEQAESLERYPAQHATSHERNVQRQQVQSALSSQHGPPLREQRARLGQPNPYGTSSQNPQSLARRSIPSGQQSQGDGYQHAARSAGASSSRPLYPRPSMDAPTYAQQHQRPAQGFPQSRRKPINAYYEEDSHPLPRQEPEQPKQRSAHMHYSTEGSQPLPRADALEEWQGDDEEVAGMQHGDWEQNRDEVPTYQQADADPYARPRTPSSFAEREMPRIPHSEMQGHITRNLREVPMPAPPSTPQPQPRAQEVQRYHRRTQPLNPQAVADMQMQESAGSGQHLVRREMVVQEQVLQYAPVAVPPPLARQGICPICKGAGYLRQDVPVGHPHFGKPVACECKEEERREKRRLQLLELSDLSAFRHRSFDSFNTRFPGVHPSVQLAFQEAYAFAQNPKGWLILIGPNGCGKTHLAAAIANQSLNDGAVVLFTVVPDLLANLRATFSPTSTEAYEERFAKMREAEVLVLDDLGAHQSSPWANEKLFQLLNYRYNSCYPTVITANKQGLSSIDERILSRLSDTALAVTVLMNGAIDYRRQNPRRELR